MTTIPVERELLSDVRHSLEELAFAGELELSCQKGIVIRCSCKDCMTDRAIDVHGRLRKLLAEQPQADHSAQDLNMVEQPQAGAGQVLPEDLDAVAFCGCRIVHSRKNGNILVQCAQHVAAQRPARHDQANEVRRLREALEAIADCTDDDQARNCALIALSASTGQEVEP